uniref:Uncharacterized protein n=1 Tax=Leersia perrieri TaxID=77586 RepID=A0A0D9WUP6_9ORYZ
MAAAIRGAIVRRPQVMARARHVSGIAGGEGSPEVHDYRVWDQGLSAKLTETSTFLSQRDLMRESTESLILERSKKIGTHNIRHVWMVAGLAISRYFFGSGAYTLFRAYENRTLGAAKEREKLRKKLAPEV